MRKLFPIVTVLTALALIVCQRSEVGWISIQSTPEGAAVYLDDSLTGEVTNCILSEVPAGEHHLKLTLDGYFDWEDSVEVETDDTVTVNAELGLEAFVIVISSTPQGADVFLDDNPTGKKTNCTLDSLTLGEHTVKLTLSGYKDWEREVVIEVAESVNLDAYLLPVSVSEGDLLWKYNVGSENTLGPAIGFDGTIYVGGADLTFYAIKPAGTMKWTTFFGNNSSPTIGPDGTIYVSGVGYYQQIPRYLCSINTDGEKDWSFSADYRIEPPFAVSSEGTVYCATRYGPLYAISPEGSLLWEYPNGAFPVGIASDGTIYARCCDSLLALSPQGERLWCSFVADSALFSAFAIGGNGTIYFASNSETYEEPPFLNQTYFWAFNPSGSEKWRYDFQSEDIWGTPVIGSNGTVYVFSEQGYLNAFDPNNGSLKSRTQIGGYSYSSYPTIGADGTIYVALDNKLKALSPNGSLKWEYEKSGNSVAISPDGVIYFKAADGFLYAIYSESKGLTQSPWPKYQRDNQNTSNAAWPIR